MLGSNNVPEDSVVPTQSCQLNLYHILTQQQNQEELEQNTSKEDSGMGFLQMIRHKSSTRYVCDLKMQKLHEDIMDIEKYISTELKIEVFIEQAVPEISSLSSASIRYEENQTLENLG